MKSLLCGLALAIGAFSTSALSFTPSTAYDSSVETWKRAGTTGGGAVVEYMVGTPKRVNGKDLGRSGFNDLILARFRTGYEFSVIVPIDMCSSGVGRVTVLDTEHLQLYPAWTVADVLQVLQQAASGGNRVVDTSKLFEPVSVATAWLCSTAR